MQGRAELSPTHGWFEKTLSAPSLLLQVVPLLSVSCSSWFLHAQSCWPEGRRREGSGLGAAEREGERKPNHVPTTGCHTHSSFNPHNSPVRGV